jgi:hypothetical protein
MDNLLTYQLSASQGQRCLELCLLRMKSESERTVIQHVTLFRVILRCSQDTTSGLLHLLALCSSVCSRDSHRYTM